MAGKMTEVLEKHTQGLNSRITKSGNDELSWKLRTIFLF